MFHLTIVSLCCVCIIILHIQSVTTRKVSPNGRKKFSFASYYSDHMVLQKAPASAVVWGYGVSIGDPVNVTVSGIGPVYTSVTEGPVPGQPIWFAKLPPVTAGGPHTITAVTSVDQVSISDVLFGDVWLCSGQSNMQFTLDLVFNASSELKDVSSYKNIRVFALKMKGSGTPEYDTNDIAESWSLPANYTIGEHSWKYFSAVCWLYGKYLSGHLNYPIGLIDTSFGGTRVEAWSSPDALAKCGLKPERGLEKLNVSDVNPNSATVLWNSMIHPLLNMSIYGAIWYQGESNAFPPKGFPDTMDVYNCTFPAMINDWRKKFHEGTAGQTDEEFPFGFVQLAPFRNDSSISSGFPDIRWHQTADEGTVPNDKMKNVFMAVAIDLPDYTSPFSGIHPRDKQDVAKRLFLSGLAVAYNETEVVYQGPFPDLFIVELFNRSIKIFYNGNGSVLNIKSVDGFEICCFDQKKAEDCHSPTAAWHSVTITSHDTNSLTFSYNNECPDVLPGAVRYAWRESPCPFKACAVYDVVSELPGPPFIKYLMDVKYDVKYNVKWVN